MLRQLGNSFIVQPNVLKSYMTESHLGRIELKLLRPYLQQRVDYSTFAKSLNLEDAPGTMLINPRDEDAADRDRKKLNRMSTTISGVAGAGMGKLKAVLKEFEAGILTPEEEEAMRKYERQGGKGQGPQVGGMRYMPPNAYMVMH